MKKINFVLFALVIGLVLCLPSVSIAQKNKKPKTNSTKKTTPTTSSNQTNVSSAEWKWLTSEVGRFNILLPTKPQTSVRNVQGTFGPVRGYTFISRLNSEIGFSIFAQTPYIQSSLSKNEILSNILGYLPKDNLSFEDISNDEFVSARATFSNSKEAGYGIVAYKISSRMVYVLIVAAKDSDTIDKFTQDVKKFFESFKAL